MTIAPPPPHAPLPVEHARAARRAGALGGALVGVGLPLALSPLAAWGLTAYFVWMLSLPGSRPDASAQDTQDTIAVFERMADMVVSPIGIVLAILCVLVGGAMVALGIVTSIRRLRRAGVHRPVGVALLGLLLARVGVWIVGTVLSGLPDLLAFAWFPPLIGIAFSDVYDGDVESVPILPAMIVAGIVIGVVGLVAAAGIWLGAGLLTTWWMAIALRQRVPAVAYGPPPWQQGPWQQVPSGQVPGGPPRTA